MKINSLDLVKEELWDHYSGLPSTAWYQYKKEPENEKNFTNDCIGLKNPNKKN